MKPHAGLETFHDGKPMRLLYRVASSTSGELWRIRPIFVAETEERERVHPRRCFAPADPRRHGDYLTMLAFLRSLTLPLLWLFYPLLARGAVSGVVDTAPYGYTTGLAVLVSGDPFPAWLQNEYVEIGDASYFVIVVLDSEHLVLLTNPGSHEAIPYRAGSTAPARRPAPPKQPR